MAAVATQVASVTPGQYPITDEVRGRSYEGLSLEEAFTRIYSTGAWGKGSGAGSLPAHCLQWISFVRGFIRERHVSSVVDLGCGDWQFSPYIYHDLQGVQYTGYDVVEPVIEANRNQWGPQGYAFEHLEFSTCVPDIRDAELYILKDVLQHWSSARISRFLRELLSSKNSLRFVLLCNCAEPEDWPEDDIADGGWRPLFASRPPLCEFGPRVLLCFPSRPNKKEVCLLLPRAPRTATEVAAADTCEMHRHPEQHVTRAVAVAATCCRGRQVPESGTTVSTSRRGLWPQWARGRRRRELPRPSRVTDG